MGIFSKKPKLTGSAMALTVRIEEYSDEMLKNAAEGQITPPSLMNPVKTWVTHEPSDFRLATYCASQVDAAIWIASVLERLGATDRRVVRNTDEMSIVEFRLPTDP